MQITFEKMEASDLASGDVFMLGEDAEEFRAMAEQGLYYPLLHLLQGCAVRTGKEIPPDSGGGTVVYRVVIS